MATYAPKTRSILFFQDIEDKLQVVRDVPVPANVPARRPSNYMVIDPEAIIRNGKFEPTSNIIPRWTEVIVTKNQDKYSFVVDLTGKAFGWTSMANLYALFWNPTSAENIDAYKKISNRYFELMTVLNPLETYKDLQLSGSAVKETIDKYYPNLTEEKDLDPDFLIKYLAFKKFLNDNGIQTTINAGVRHPLRSTVFHYAIAVRDADGRNIIREANAVCRKYGVPIDWAHRTSEGNIDVDKSKMRAEALCNAFSIASLAAKGIPDFGGVVSNHNSGKALDLRLTFPSSKPIKVKIDNIDYTIKPDEETTSGKFIANIGKKTLAVIGKKHFGITRDMDTDVIHWSETGR